MHVDDVCVKVLPSVGMSEDVWLSGVFGGKSVSLECITGHSRHSFVELLNLVCGSL